MGKDDKFAEGFKGRMDPATMKDMKGLLGKDDELGILKRMHDALNMELRDVQRRYNVIEFTMRMINHRISGIKKEKATRKMVEKGRYIEGEF